MTAIGTPLAGPTWADVLGQPAAVAALRSALRAGEVAHAWLLVGPAGVGQREAVRALAAALNCEQAVVPDEGCGACSTCERIARGTHPAVAELEPEGQFHVVDAVRSEWIPAATRTLVEGRRRVLRVVAADRMNDAAQNAFLRILEEPPPSVVWVLEAADESALLDTVMSRCRRLDVVPWSPDALRAFATRLGIPEADRDALSRAALGSPQRLQDLADPELARARRDHLGILDRLATAGPGQVVPVAKEVASWARSRTAAVKARNQEALARFEEAYGVEGSRGWPPGIKLRLTRRFERLERQEVRRSLDLFLDTLASALRDLLVLQAGGDAARTVNVDHVEALRRDAARLPALSAVDGLRAITRCREALDRNGNVELQLERLLLALALPLYATAPVR